MKGDEEISSNDCIEFDAVCPDGGLINDPEIMRLRAVAGSVGIADVFLGRKVGSGLEKHRKVVEK